MYIFIVTVNLISMVMMIYMIVWACLRRSSKVQISFIISVLLTLFYVLGYHLSITNAQSMQANYAFAKIQYFAQCGLLMTYLWFFSETMRIHIPASIYITQAIVELSVLVSVFTMENNTLFYTKEWIDRSGDFTTFEVDPGLFFWVHYINFACFFLFVEIVALKRYKRSGKIQKKRIKSMLAGYSMIWIELILKQSGCFGKYNMISIALSIMMLCFFVSIVKYGYFDSVQVAMENVLNHGNEAMIVLSEHYRVLYYNEMAKKLLPNLNSKLIAQSEPLLVQALQKPVSEVTLNECIYEMRTEALMEETDISGYVIWMIDMTSHYATLAELEAMRDKAEVANRAKSTFLANMSHEIRTPINAVLGMDEIILRESKEPDIQKYAANIQNAGKILLTLVNDTLDFSKIESGKMEIMPVEYQLSSLLNDIVNMVAPKAKEKGLELILKIDPELPEYLFGDEIRVKQVITNLLTNAVKYTEQGTVALKINGEYIADHRCINLCVAVSDTGRGIKEEDLAKLFDSFCRLEAEKNRGIEGTGLGLTICKQLAGKMEGTIEVESTYGKGSIFTFLVPQGVIKNDEMGDYQKRYEKNQQELNMYRERFIAPDATVLVVDDNEMNLSVATGLLKCTKVKVDTAQSGAECLSMIQKKKYDVVFMDHLMPHMDGIETLKKMKETLANLCIDTPVIALTANAISGARQTYLKAGFSDYLTKPISGAMLEDTLLKYLPKEYIKQDASQIEYDEKVQKRDLDNQAELLASYGIMFNEGMKYFNDNTEGYRELLADFYRNSEEMKLKMQEYIQHGDVAKYQILVHSLKSNAKNLGANQLSELAAVQERMSKEGNLTYISDHWKLLKTNWDITLFGIQVYLGDALLTMPNEVVTEHKMLPKEKIVPKLRDIICLIDEFEIDKAVIELQQLLKYQYEQAVTDKLVSALKHVNEFEYEEAIALLKNLCMICV